MAPKAKAGGQSTLMGFLSRKPAGGASAPAATPRALPESLTGAPAAAAPAGEVKKRKLDDADADVPAAKKAALGTASTSTSTPTKKASTAKAPRTPKAKADTAADAKSAKSPAADKGEKTEEEVAKTAARARYFQMMRTGYDNSALNKGSKPIPEGADTCLDKMTFVVTGRLDGMDRTEAETLIKRHGGAVRTGVSKKLSYLVVGEEPGDSKIRKAKECNTPHLSEDGLIKLVVAASEKMGVDAWKGQAVDRKVWGGLSFAPAEEEPAKGASKEDAHSLSSASSSSSSTETESDSDVEEAAPAKKPAPKAAPAPQPQAAVPTALSFLQQMHTQQAQPNRPVPFGQQHAQVQQGAPAPARAPAPPVPAKEELWADKYAPKSVDKIIGHGARANELRSWLLNWRHNAKAFRANPKAKMEWKSGVCISGPPGIGKTTTSTLIAKECGYDVVELNASDHRSQKTLREHVTCLLGGKSVLSMLKGGRTAAHPEKDIVIIMDEIGGLDRGGTTEIIAMLKAARTPIICICNDKYAQKLKSLVGHCMDMPFARPPKNVVAGYLKRLLRENEGVDLHEQALVEVLEAAGNDMRATLNNLQMWSRTAQRLSYDDLRKSQGSAMKDADMSPFQSAQKLFQTYDLSFNTAKALFFDNDLLQLFVQENYIHSGGRLGSDRIDAMAKASRSIAMGDIMDTSIRRSQNWSLGTAVAFQSAYYPIKVLGRHQLVSYLPPMVRQNLPCFPGYLGKLSTMNKNLRMATGITREGTASGKLQCTSRAMTMDYLPTLRRRVEALMCEGNADGAAALLAEYKICKFDWDFTQEIDTYKKMTRPSKHESGDTKTKSALTRTLNKLMDVDEVKARRSHMAAPSAGPGPEENGDADNDSSDEDDDKAKAKPGKKPAAKKASGKASSARKRPATEAKQPGTAPKRQKKTQQNTR